MCTLSSNILVEICKDFLRLQDNFHTENIFLGYGCLRNLKDAKNNV